MTQERDLIQRMADELDLYRQLARNDCTSTHPIADEARAFLVLAQPELQGPTDEELDELWAEIDGGGAIWAWQHYARAVLARWALPVPDSSTTTHCKR